MKHSERRFIHTQSLHLLKWRRPLLLALLLTCVPLLISLAWLPQMRATALIKILFIGVVAAAVLLVEAEIVSNSDGLRINFYLALKRRLVFSRRFLWVDTTRVKFHRAPAASSSTRFNIIVRLVPTLRQQFRLSGSLSLLINHWVLHEQIEEYESARKEAPWWRSGSARVVYSDAPQFFQLAQVFREQGYEVNDFSPLPGLAEINLKKPMVQGALWFGLSCAVLAFIIAFASEWLYVEPHQGWYVAACAAAVAALVILIGGVATKCDATSVVGAILVGGLGFAFFAAIVAPDASALFDTDKRSFEFTKAWDGTWNTTDKASTVKTLFEPPLQSINEPTRVHVSCGLPNVCAFKRTDFKFLGT